MGRVDSSARKRPLQDGLSKESSLKRRAKREGDATYEAPADSGAAAREGRPFTVSNVGNNGKIYLR